MDSSDEDSGNENYYIPEEEDDDEFFNISDDDLTTSGRKRKRVVEVGDGRKGKIKGDVLGRDRKEKRRKKEENDEISARISAGMGFRPRSRRLINYRKRGMLKANGGNGKEKRKKKEEENPRADNKGKGSKSGRKRETKEEKEKEVRKEKVRKEKERLTIMFLEKYRDKEKLIGDDFRNFFVNIDYVLPLLSNTLSRLYGFRDAQRRYETYQFPLMNNVDDLGLTDKVDFLYALMGLPGEAMMRDALFNDRCIEDGISDRESFMSKNKFRRRDPKCYVTVPIVPEYSDGIGKASWHRIFTLRSAKGGWAECADIMPLHYGTCFVEEPDEENPNKFTTRRRIYSDQEKYHDYINELVYSGNICESDCIADEGMDCEEGKSLRNDSWKTGGESSCPFGSIRELSMACTVSYQEVLRIVRDIRSEHPLLSSQDVHGDLPALSKMMEVLKRESSGTDIDDDDDEGEMGRNVVFEHASWIRKVVKTVKYFLHLTSMTPCARRIRSLIEACKIKTGVLDDLDGGSGDQGYGEVCRLHMTRNEYIEMRVKKESEDWDEEEETSDDNLDGGPLETIPVFKFCVGKRGWDESAVICKGRVVDGEIMELMIYLDDIVKLLEDSSMAWIGDDPVSFFEGDLFRHVRVPVGIPEGVHVVKGYWGSSEPDEEKDVGVEIKYTGSVSKTDGEKKYWRKRFGIMKTEQKKGKRRGNNENGIEHETVLNVICESMLRAVTDLYLKCMEYHSSARILCEETGRDDDNKLVLNLIQSTNGGHTLKTEKYEAEVGVKKIYSKELMGYEAEDDKDIQLVDLEFDVDSMTEELEIGTLKVLDVPLDRQTKSWRKRLPATESEEVDDSDDEEDEYEEVEGKIFDQRIDAMRGFMSDGKLRSMMIEKCDGEMKAIWNKRMARLNKIGIRNMTLREMRDTQKNGIPSLIDVEGYKAIRGIHSPIGIAPFPFPDLSDKIFMPTSTVSYVVKKHYEGNDESGVPELGNAFYLGLPLTMHIPAENIYFYEDEARKFRDAVRSDMEVELEYCRKWIRKGKGIFFGLTEKDRPGRLGRPLGNRCVEIPKDDFTDMVCRYSCIPRRMSYRGFPTNLVQSEIYHSGKPYPNGRKPMFIHNANPKKDRRKGAENFIDPLGEDVYTQSMQVLDPETFINSRRESGTFSYDDVNRIVHQELFLDYLFRHRKIMNRAYEEMASLGHCYNARAIDTLRTSVLEDGYGKEERSMGEDKTSGHRFLGVRFGANESKDRRNKVVEKEKEELETKEDVRMFKSKMGFVKDKMVTRPTHVDGCDAFIFRDMIYNVQFRVSTRIMALISDYVTCRTSLVPVVIDERGCPKVVSGIQVDEGGKGTIESRFEKNARRVNRGDLPKNFEKLSKLETRIFKNVMVTGGETCLSEEEVDCARFEYAKLFGLRPESILGDPDSFYSSGRLWYVDSMVKDISLEEFVSDTIGSGHGDIYGDDGTMYDEKRWSEA